MPSGRSKEELAKIGKRFSSEYQPPRYREASLLTKIKKKVFDEESFLDFFQVDEITAEGNPTGRRVNVRIAMVNADALTLRYTEALMTDNKMLRDFLDRVDGKAVQRVEVGASKSDIEKQEEANLFIQSLSPELQEQIFKEIRDKALRIPGVEIEDAEIIEDEQEDKEKQGAEEPDVETG